jgi:hypothetical protein
MVYFCERRGVDKIVYLGCLCGSVSMGRGRKVNMQRGQDANDVWMIEVRKGVYFPVAELSLN